MCGRFVADLSPGQLADVFGVPSPAEYPARFNVSPTQNVLVIRQYKNMTRHLDQLRWGLLPSWSKELGNGLINARSETVDSKPSFRQAFKYRRCILPASGFYEWQKTRAGKIPHFIQLEDGSPLAFAGIWETWLSPEGSAIESCSILTTSANRLVGPIHDRMPVIIATDNFDEWLDIDNDNTDSLKHLFTPYPPDRMKTYPVSTLVNNPGNDNPDCILNADL